MRTASLVCTLLLLSAGASAAQLTWAGTTGSPADLWSDGSKWTAEGVVPGSTAGVTDTAIISNSGTCAVQTDLSANPGSIDYVYVGAPIAGGVASTWEVRDGTVLNIGTGVGAISLGSTYFSGNMLMLAGTVNFNGFMTLGNDVGKEGIATINGGQVTIASTSSSAQTWDIGKSGTGKLILNGGTVNLMGNTTVAHIVYLGSYAGGSGLIQVNAGSSLNMCGTGGSQQFYVGYRGGTGNIEVNGGSFTFGKFNVDSTYALSLGTGDNYGSSGFLKVTSGTMTVYRALEIGSGIGSSGDVTVTGGTLVIAATNARPSYVGNSGSGQLTVDGGTVKINEGMPGSAGLLYVARNPTGSGTILLKSGRLEVGLNSAAAGIKMGYLARTSTTGTGTLQIDGGSMQVGSAVNRAYIFMGCASGAEAKAFINDGDMTAYGAWEVGSAVSAAASVLQTGGTVTTKTLISIGKSPGNCSYTITGGSLIADWNYNQDNGGGIILAASNGDGKFYQYDGTVTTEALSIVRKSSTSSASYTLAGGLLNVRDGYAESAAKYASAIFSNQASANAAFNWTGGVLQATGTIQLSGPLANTGTGTLKVGDPVGSLRIWNGYTQGSLAAMNLDLNGTTAGTSYDQILILTGIGVNATNVLSLAGALNLNVGYSPAATDSLTLIDNQTANPVSGTFANLKQGQMVGVYGPVGLFISYTAGTGNDVVLTGGVAGDCNDDGAVDGSDYAAWFNCYGQSVAAKALGDMNCDGSVDGTDYALWFNNYGYGGAQSVPEPATMALLALGSLALLRRRRTA